MNNEELKKLLKSVEVCASGDIVDCDGCPFIENRFDGCEELQHNLAKRLLKELERKETATEEKQSNVFICDDKTTVDIIKEYLYMREPMTVGFKTNASYKQWYVGRVIVIDLEKKTIAIRGISGSLIYFPLSRYCRLIRWTGGPTAELICIDDVAGYKIGRCYYIRDGNLSVDHYGETDNQLLCADGRFASLEDEFIKKNFAQWKGNVHFGREDLNGYFVCTGSSGNFTKGKQYEVVNGCFQDDNGIVWDELVTGYMTLDELLEQSNLRYVPND